MAQIVGRDCDCEDFPCCGHGITQADIDEGYFFPNESVDWDPEELAERDREPESDEDYDEEDESNG